MQPQKQYKILLVGETCQDEYVYGDVDRISPEAPIPVNILGPKPQMVCLQMLRQT